MKNVSIKKLNVLNDINCVKSNDTINNIPFCPLDNGRVLFTLQNK